MIDELEDQLAAALRERADTLGPVPVSPTDLRRRVVRRRRRRIAVPVTAVLGLVAGLLVSRTMPHRSLSGEPTVTVGPNETVETTGTSVVAPSTTATTTTSTGSPPPSSAEPLPTFGIDGPAWLIRSTVEVSTPATKGARRLIEYGIGDDWRSTPTLDVVDRTPSSTDAQTVAGSLTIAGRSATLSVTDGLTIVRVEVGPARTVEFWGWGLDQDTTVHAAASLRLEEDRVVIDPPTGLGLRRDTDLPMTVRTRISIYEPATASSLGDGFVQVLVSDDPVVGLFSRPPLGAWSEIDGVSALVTPKSALMRLPDNHIVTLQFDGPASQDGSTFELLRRQLDGSNQAWVSATAAASIDTTYPTAGADSRIAAFTQGLPPSYDIVDRMAPLERGISLGAFADDNWIRIEFAHATIAGASGTTEEPVVTASTTTQRTLHWRSPSGWVYDLTADGTKADRPPPLTEAQMIDLLRAVDTA